MGLGGWGWDYRCASRLPVKLATCLGEGWIWGVEMGGVLLFLSRMALVGRSEVVSEVLHFELEGRAAGSRYIVCLCVRHFEGCGSELLVLLISIMVSLYCV